jgi:tRNA(Ile)-lysidine synthase
MASPDPTLDRDHIRPGDRICAAVSGGADSVALLLLLHAANALPRNALGVGLSAIHVHHGLRGEEADSDLAFVQELCARLGIPLHVQHVDVATRAATHRETTEEAARTLRYECFAALLAAGHADAVLTAHTLDDQAETVLMKLLRGAWTEGLGGIHPVVLLEGNKTLENNQPGRILRPLLSVRRAELEDYLRERDQPWREDSSNADTAFTRNRVRRHLLPILREYNPNLDQALANLAELARDDEAHWQQELSRMLPQLLLPGKPVRGGGRAVPTTSSDASVAVDLDRLRALAPALRRRVLRAAARSLGARLTFDETARLLALAGLVPSTTVSAGSGSVLHLAEGLRGQRSARELRLFRAGPLEPASDTQKPGRPSPKGRKGCPTTD